MSRGNNACSKKATIGRSRPILGTDQCPYRALQDGKAASQSSCLSLEPPKPAKTTTTLKDTQRSSSDFDHSQQWPHLHTILIFSHNTKSPTSLQEFLPGV